jgi:hypothetical protein
VIVVSLLVGAFGRNEREGRRPLGRGFAGVWFREELRGE